MSATSYPSVALGELVSFKTGKLDSNAAVADGVYPFFTCSPQTLRTNTFAFDSECVLLAGNNATGTFPIKYFRGKFDAYQRTYVIAPQHPDLLLTRYLYYALMLKLEELKSLSTGAATKFLTLPILRGIEVSVPPLDIQSKVVSALSSFDELVAANSRRIEILEEIGRRLYREWFVDYRFPGHETVSFVESELGLIPRGWVVTSLGERFDVVLGGTPSRSVERYWREGSVPWINSGRVNDLRVMSPSQLITDEAVQKSNTKLMRRGTTLIAITGATLGQVSMLEIDACANQSVIGVYSSDRRLDEYLHLSIRHSIERIISAASGGAQQHINRQIVGDTKIVVPTDDHIDVFHRMLRPMYEEVRALLMAKENLLKTSEYLLPRLISGQVSVEDLNISVDRSGS